MDNGHSRSLTIKEAAEVLGITPIAVRKRLLRGRLPGHKDDHGQWFVDLPGDMPPPTNGHARGHDLATTAAVSALNRLVEQQREEIAFLRATLERVGEERAEAERRRDILLSQFAEQMRALSHTATSVQETVEAVAQEVLPPEEEAPASPRPSWWRWLLYGSAA